MRAFSESATGLFIALLFVCVNAGAYGEELQQHRDVIDGPDVVTDPGSGEVTPSDYVLSSTIVAGITPAQTSSVDHRYHRHATHQDLLEVRAATMNSTTTSSIPTTTNSRALSCYSTYSKWRKSWMKWEETAIGNKTFSSTTTISTITQILDTVATVYPTKSLSTYKLCDGSPRVDFEPLTLTSKYTSTSTYEAYVTLGTPTFTPQPCKASSKDCEDLYYNSGLSWDDITLMALCGVPAHLGLPCLIAGGPVELAYFPVTTVGGDKCHSNGSTITNTGGPTTIKALNTTLTSGSVYLSFKTLYAFQEGFGNRIGPAFTDFIMPLPSSAISTQCGGWFSAQGPGTPLNYADLNYPWPASAYNCMNRCSTDVSITQINGTAASYKPPRQCSTIWSDMNPILAMPTQVRNLVPAWSTCSMWDAALPNFVFDPPRALIEGTAVADPTPAFEMTSTTTPASPASTTYTALAETVASTATTTTPPSTIATADTSTAIPPSKGIGSTAIMIQFSVDGHTFTASAGSNAFAIESQTISVGGPAQVIEGETISLGLAGFVINSTTTVPFSSHHSSHMPSATTSNAMANSVTQSATGGKKTAKSEGSILEISSLATALAVLLAALFV